MRNEGHAQQTREVQIRLVADFGLDELFAFLKNL